MTCRLKIEGIRFNSPARRALKHIRHVTRLAKTLKLTSAGGHILPLFLAASAPESLYTVYSTDWRVLSKAIKSISRIERSKVEQIVDMQGILRSGKEGLFWKTLSQCVGRLNV